MPEDFDAYFEWLGIPPAEQPPHHYRLLGIPLYVDNVKVIEHAADQRMVHVRTFQAGIHSATSQRLLNMLAGARICLLNPAKKAAYDEQLRRTLQPPDDSAGSSQGEGADPGLPGRLDPRSRTTPLPAKSKPAMPKSLMFGGAAILALVLVGTLVWATTRGNESGDTNRANADTQASGKGANRKASKAPLAANDGSGATRASLKKADAATLPVASPPEPAQPQPKPDTPPATEAEPPGEVAGPPAEQPKPELVEAASQKIVPPSVQEQARLIAAIDEVYKVGKAKDPAAKVAVARKLLEDGRANNANSAEQFVMLRRAGELARDAGDTDLMFEAVDAIVEAGFNIASWKAKASLVKHMLAQGDRDDASQSSAVAAACVKLAEQAAAGGANNEAFDVLNAAQAALIEAKKQSQGRYRAARLTMNRARTAADKAEREKKVQEAEAEVGSLDAALSGVTECVKGLRQARLDRDALQAARERLKAQPDDPEACSAVGHWLCFDQSEWDEGLKLLAKGNSDVLKSLAAGDLSADPSKVDDRVARGDAWWDAAKKSQGEAKGALRRRASHWYQEALPELAGLAKARVETRLAEASAEPEPEGASARGRPPPAVAPFDERTAKSRQASWAKYLRAPVVQANSIGMKLVLIPPGEFEMGSPKELIEAESKVPGLDSLYKSRLPSEAPRHRVRITNPYWLGATEVTQEEYQRVMGSNPSKFHGDPKRPVEQVSCNDAAEFCRKLSELPAEKAANRRYVLPTEAQWEYAALAGSPGRWCFDERPQPVPPALEEQLLGEYGWGKETSGGQTHPVGQKRPNAFGLYDVLGNAWECCQDWYGDDFYSKSPTNDPTGPPTGSIRVYRGGCLLDAARYCRSNRRHGYTPDTRYFFTGFRVSVALTLK